MQGRHITVLLMGITSLTMSRLCVAADLIASRNLQQCALCQPAGGAAAQGDGEVIERVPVNWTEDHLTQALSRQLSFWSGQAPPAPVAADERWKCTFCHFRKQCPTGLDVARQQGL